MKYITLVIEHLIPQFCIIKKLKTTPELLYTVYIIYILYILYEAVYICYTFNFTTSALQSWKAFPLLIIVIHIIVKLFSGQVERKKLYFYNSENTCQE